MDGPDLVSFEVGPIGLVSREFRETEVQLVELETDGFCVFLFERSGVVTECVVSLVVTVFRHFVNEKQGEHLDALPVERLLLVQVGPDSFPDLDSTLRVLGHILRCLT